MAFDELTLEVDQQISINVGLETTYAGVIRRLTEESKTPGGPMPMNLEQWPGGRWFRDLGNDAGHLWGYVQVLKPPTLLEIANAKGDASHNMSLDGRSITSLLRDPTAELDRDLYWHYPHYHAGGDSPYSAIRSRNWRLA